MQISSPQLDLLICNTSTNNQQKLTSLSTFATTYTTQPTIYRSTGYHITFRDDVTCFVIGLTSYRTDNSTNSRRRNSETGHIHNIVPRAEEEYIIQTSQARSSRTSQANKFAISWWVNGDFRSSCRETRDFSRQLFSRSFKTIVLWVRVWLISVDCQCLR